MSQAVLSAARAPFLGVLSSNLNVSGRSISRILSSAEAPGRPSLYAVYPGLDEASSLSSLFDLAPGGGYQAAHITADAGGLLHHLFTIATSLCSPLLSGEGLGVRWQYIFCGPIRQIAPPRGFPGAALYGVRTFLDPSSKIVGPRPSDRPETHSSYLPIAPASIPTLYSTQPGNRQTSYCKSGPDSLK